MSHHPDVLIAQSPKPHMTIIIEHEHALYVPTGDVVWQEASPTHALHMLYNASLIRQHQLLCIQCDRALATRPLIAGQDQTELRMKVFQATSQFDPERRIIRIGLGETPCEHFFRVGYGELD